MHIFDIQKQKEFCKRVGSKYVECDFAKFVGISKNFDKANDPIYGLRHPIEGRGTGWFIWSGQEMSKDDDFFQPLHAQHLKKIAPKIVPYLGLEPGWGFVIDSNGYEDVWFDEELLKI